MVNSLMKTAHMLKEINWKGNDETSLKLNGPICYLKYLKDLLLQTWNLKDLWMYFAYNLFVGVR
jgi:hypothetical protein